MKLRFGAEESSWTEIIKFYIILLRNFSNTNNYIRNLDLEHPISRFMKKDGFLGILYWTDGLPFLATRNSFISYPGIRGNAILYNKYSHLFHLLDSRYTYFFEIVFPNDFLVTDYGETEDLFLLGAYDNDKMLEIPLENIDLPIPRVRRYHMHGGISELMQHDSARGEGYVLLFDDHSRLKIKFPQ